MHLLKERKNILNFSGDVLEKISSERVTKTILTIISSLFQEEEKSKFPSSINLDVWQQVNHGKNQVFILSSTKTRKHQFSVSNAGTLRYYYNRGRYKQQSTYIPTKTSKPFGYQESCIKQKKFQKQLQRFKSDKIKTIDRTRIRNKTIPGQNLASYSVQ